MQRRLPSFSSRQRLTSWLTGLAVLAAPAIASADVSSAAALASAASQARVSAGDPVVFHWTKTVSSDGKVTEATPVRTILDRLDTPQFSIDLDTLEDSEGQRYRMEADAWQAEEGGEVHYELKLVRYTPHLRTFDEQARQWEVDTGGKSDLKGFLTQKRTAAISSPKLSKGLQAWRAEAKADDAIEVVIVLEDSPPLRLPKVSPGLFDAEPALALEQLQDRILTIEERKTEIEVLQQPISELLASSDARVLERYWLFNGLEARVSARTLEALAKDPRVRTLERREATTVDTNNLDDMREGTQIAQFHDGGFEGETGSGASTINDIHLAVIDDNVDIDHPAWDDWAGGPSRLVDVWRRSGGVWSSVSSSATATPSHGTKVAGLAMSDLMQGQDSSITTTADRDDRTGFAPEASFSFIEKSAGMTTSIEKAVDESVDIINLSISSGYSCSLSHSTNDAVDQAMLAGIFVVKASGSNGGGAGVASCNLGNPGAASGAFSVAATTRTAVPLYTGSLTGGSSHGPDAAGRAGVAMAAPSGTEGLTTPQVGDTYGVFGATSAAAPVVAGSAAVLKEHLIDVFGASLINDVGFLYAGMLVMGDGETASGTAGAGVAVDGSWGVGRLRARMFNAAGMDGPWRMRLFSRVIEDGELADDLLVNPDSSGVNQPLSSDVDRLRASVFWHEPNLEDSTSDYATIGARICGGPYCYGSGSSTDSRQRLRLGNVVQGYAWTIKLEGYDVPDSNDSDYYSGQDKRKVYVAMYFEDQDRDDADGPDSTVW